MSDLSVLILGENGTGKELFAHSIHQHSLRSSFPFVAVNCSALPDNLLESELFGYEEGAFTGAKKGGKPGLFEQAHRGTIFLDEIGDISPSLQSKLLRVLQYKEVLKVGGTRVLPVDVRVIAATNRDLLQLVKEAKFREDLFYRLNVLQVVIPPLRERKDDITLLAEKFLQRTNAKKRLTAEVLRAFRDYHWPGNVRELENQIKYLSIMSDGDLVAEDLPFIKELSHREVSSEMPEKLQRSTPGAVRAPVPLECTEVSIEHFLLEVILEAKTNGNSTGRRSLIRLARDKGLILTENAIRRWIEQLRQSGLVEVAVGRSGCSITSKGYQALQYGKSEHHPWILM